MNSIVQILSSKNWLPYFKPIAQTFNANDPAILLSELANQHQFYESKDALDDEGYFYCSSSKLEEETCLSRHKQTKALRLLMGAGLIEEKLKGVPATKHFRFPKDFQNKFSNFLKTGLQKNAKQDCKKFKTNEKRKNKKILSKTDNKISEAEDSAPFSDSDLKDFETQIKAGAPAISIPAGDDGTGGDGKIKDNSKKEISPKILARRVWDKNYRAWMLKRKGVVAEENDGIYWNPVEIGQLTNFLKALTSKAKGKGKEYTDRQVVEIALNDFLQAAANLDVWYLSAFTPTNLYKNFNTLYCDVLNFMKNGKNNDSRSTRNGHGISQAARAATVAMLD